ncbi:MAG: galactokinase [Georgenia sp.]
MLAPWPDADGAARVRGLFVRAFGTEPDGVWAAPGRVNLVGEHTDYNDGLCLPIALPHRTFVAVRARQDRLMRLVSAQDGGAAAGPSATVPDDGASGGAAVPVVELDLGVVGPVGGPGEVRGWPAYAVGVAWAIEQAGLGRLPGFDVAVDSCVPLGAGLSSSAALECAVAVALDDVARLGLGADDAGRARLATACVRAENEVAGAPTGGMDQAASLRATAGHALLLDTRDGGIEQVPLDLAAAGLVLLVIDTRAEHRLVDGQYARRRQVCEDAARALGVASLRVVADDVDGQETTIDEVLARLPDLEQRRRVRHVVTEIERVRSLVAQLDTGGRVPGGIPAAGEPGGVPAAGEPGGDATASEPGGDATASEPGGAPALGGWSLQRVAETLDASHESLRLDYEVSSLELDVAVAAARGAGAHGARMTGGGFGGSAIALVDAESARAVMTAVTSAFAEAGLGAPAFLLADAAGPAGRVS